MEAPAPAVTITERGYRDTALGRCLQLKVFAPGYPVLTWGQVWAAFVAAYPGRWAVQVFPPAGYLVDSKNVYHLFVCAGEPQGLNLR